MSGEKKSRVPSAYMLGLVEPLQGMVPWICGLACSASVWSVYVQANLRRAYAIEEGMGYMEPPRQYQPTKHCLGYVLMRAGNNQTAAEVLLTPIFPSLM